MISMIRREEFFYISLESSDKKHETESSEQSEVLEKQLLPYPTMVHLRDFRQLKITKNNCKVPRTTL